MRNKTKLSHSSKENPNPTRMNLMRDDGVPEQDDVVVVDDLAVMVVVGAEWQRQQLVGLDVAFDVETVVLPQSNGEVGGARIDSGSKTISLSIHGKRSRDGCGVLLPGCGAWNRRRHRKGRRNVGVRYRKWHWAVWVSPFLRIKLRRRHVRLRRRRVLAGVVRISVQRRQRRQWWLHQRR